LLPAAAASVDVAAAVALAAPAAFCY